MFNIFKTSTKDYEGKNFYSYTARNSNGEAIPMSTYLGKVALVVNVASQYDEAEPSALNFPTTGLADENFKQLAELDKRYRDEGLVILGFPTNQFAGHEPSVQEEIISFIRRKYNVDFEIFEKLDVNGNNTSPMFDYLKNILPGTITNDLKWHFTKFLIDRNGNPVKRYAPNDPPFSFEEEIRHLLRQESVLVKGMQAQLGEMQGQGIQGQPQGLQNIGQQGFASEKGWKGEMDKGASEKHGMHGQPRGLGQQKFTEKGWQGEMDKEQKWGGVKDLDEVRNTEEDRAYWEEIERNRLNMQKQGFSELQGIKHEKNLHGKGANWGKEKKVEKNLNIGQTGIHYTKEVKETGDDLNLQQQRDFQNLRERELEKSKMKTSQTSPNYASAVASDISNKVATAADNVSTAVSNTASNIASKASKKYDDLTSQSEQQKAMGYKKQEDLTGEGGTVGMQMGVHLGAHSLQAGVQAGKDPLKTQDQKEVLKTQEQKEVKKF